MGTHPLFPTTVVLSWSDHLWSEFYSQLSITILDAQYHASPQVFLLLREETQRCLREGRLRRGSIHSHVSLRIGS
jgi:hypothetical protein